MIRDTHTGEIYTSTNLVNDSRNMFTPEEYSASKVKIVLFFSIHVNLV